MGGGAIMNDKQRKCTQLRQLLIRPATPTNRSAQIKSAGAAVTNGCNLGNSIMSPRPNQIGQLCQFLSRQWSVLEADEPKDVLGGWVVSGTFRVVRRVNCTGRGPSAHIACNQTVCVAIFDYRLTDFVLNQLRRCHHRSHIVPPVQPTIVFRKPHAAYRIPCRVPIYLMSCLPTSVNPHKHKDAQLSCLEPLPYWFLGKDKANTIFPK